MMVRPVIARDAPPKVPLRIVCRPLRRVYQIVLVAMFLVQKGGNLIKKSVSQSANLIDTYFVDGVAVEGFEAARGVAHRDKSVGNDVGHV